MATAVWVSHSKPCFDKRSCALPRFDEVAARHTCHFSFLLRWLRKIW
jgi:hypothetical protein